VIIQVGKVLEIGRVNLLRQVRDRSDLFFVFVLPTIIIVALGLQFGGPSRARLGVVAPPGDAAADALVESLGSDTTRFEIRHIADAATLEALVERGQVEAGIVIPDGFARALEGAGTAEVRYLATPDSLTAGIREPVDAAVAKLGAITVATRVAVAGGLGSWDQARAAAAAGYETVPGVEVSVTQAGEPGVFAGFSQFTLGASTQLVLFTFLTSMTAASRLVFTKQLGLSRRMTSTPTSAWTIVTGESLGRFLVAVLQAAYIVVVTAVAFNVSWGDPVATGLLIVLFCLVAAAAAMLVGAESRNADQAASLGVFVGLALGALGGCMIPWQTMPPVMQSIARLIPHSWAVLGLQELIRTGGGLDTVAPNIAVLLGFAVVLMALAAWRFRKAITG
jgi:ABC-2 type transport system permease protein